MSANIRDGKETEVAKAVDETAGTLRERANDLVGRGTDALVSQYNTVREHGLNGIKDDVVGYARREPLKAVLVAGGIGALAALLIKKRLY